MVGGGTPDTTNASYWNGDIQWYTPSEIGKEKYVFSSNRKITSLGLEGSSAKLLPKGTILLTTRATIGESSIAGTVCATNQGFQSLIPNEKVIIDFCYYCIQNKKKELHIKASGSTFLEISNAEIKRIHIAIPRKEEQKHIATMLSILDEKISAQRRLVEALKSYKRGVLATVFDEDNCLLKIDRTSWKQYKIGDFLFPRVSKQVPTPDAPLMAFTAEGGVCPKGDRYDRSFLVKDENKQYKRTELNDFIYSSNNLDVGSIGLNKYGSAVISDVYEIFTIKGADISFIAEAICRPQTIAKILKYRQGVIYGQYRIYAENFLEVDICLPPLKEQIIYSQIFSKFDDRIVRENTLLKDLTGIKLGLLQRLFI